MTMTVKELIHALSEEEVDPNLPVHTYLAPLGYIPVERVRTFTHGTHGSMVEIISNWESPLE